MSGSSSYKSLSLFLLNRLVLSKRSGSLIRRTARLSFFAITISVAVFFIVIFVMNGMNQNIRDRLQALDPHLAIESFEQNINSDEKPKIENAIRLVGEEHSSSVLQFERFDLILRSIDGQFRGVQVLGYNEVGLNYWMKRLVDLRRKEGKPLHSMTSLEDEDAANPMQQGLHLQKDEIAIGIDLSRMLGVLEGDEVTLIPTETLLLSQLETPVFQKVVVKKILSTDLYDLDSKLVLYNRDLTLRGFSSSPSRELGFHFWLNRVDQIAKTKKYLQAEIEKLNMQSLPRIETWQEKNSDLFFALMLEKLMIGFFLGLAGLVASSSILTVLALIMSQKKHDIAILKTIGLSHRDTQMIFTKIGLAISGAGILVGTFIGVAVSFYIQLYPIEILPSIYYDSTIPALVDLRFVGIVIFVATILSVVGCYFPARATLKIQPAILLKTR